MSEHKIDVMWDDASVDVSTEVNFIWSIANKLRGTYQSDTVRAEKTGRTYRIRYCRKASCEATLC